MARAGGKDAFPSAFQSLLDLLQQQGGSGEGEPWLENEAPGRGEKPGELPVLQTFQPNWTGSSEGKGMKEQALDPHNANANQSTACRVR